MGRGHGMGVRVEEMGRWSSVECFREEMRIFGMGELA
jgi:hypothetical protein